MNGLPRLALTQTQVPDNTYLNNFHTIQLQLFLSMVLASSKSFIISTSSEERKKIVGQTLLFLWKEILDEKNEVNDGFFAVRVVGSILSTNSYAVVA